MTRRKTSSTASISVGLGSAAATPKKVAKKVMPLVIRSVTHTGGEPTTSLTPLGIDTLRRLIAKGVTRANAARKLGIGHTTLGRILERDEAVRDAYTQGLAEEEEHLVGVLRRAADKGYAPAAMFLLKSRHGYVEGAQPTTQVGVQIVLPDSLSREDYEARIAARRQAASVSPQPPSVPLLPAPSADASEDAS